MTTTTTTTTASTASMKRQQRKANPPHAGDLIFVRPATDDRVGQLVARATNGVYSHVRIRISADEVVEALPSGIVRRFLQPPLPDATDCAPTGAGLDAARVGTMLVWLVQQVAGDDGYSWWDIAADALKALLPPALGSRTPFLIQPSRFDCSALAAVAIVAAGYPLAPALIADIARISPNDLARALGVLKG